MTRTEKALLIVVAALLFCWGIGLIPGKAVALFIALVLGALVVGRA